MGFIFSSFMLSLVAQALCCETDYVSSDYETDERQMETESWTRDIERSSE